MMKKQTKLEWQRGILATGVLLGGLWLQSGEGLAASSTPSLVTQGYKATGVVQQAINSQNAQGATKKTTQQVAKKSTKKKAAPAVNSIITIQYNGTNGAASNGTAIKANGIIKDGKTWVPITFLRDALKMPVNYDVTKKMYTIGEDFHQFTIDVQDNNSLTLNGYFLNDLQATNINGHFYVPAQLLKQYLGYEAHLNAKDNIVSIKEAKQNDVSFTTQTKIESKNGIDIDLAWPQIDYSKDSQVEERINQKITDVIDAYEKEIKEQTVLREKDKINSPYLFSSSYIVTYNQKGIVSLILEQYDFIGGAHGMTYRKALTFSLKDGKQLTVTDVIGNNNNLKQINQSIKQQFEKSIEYFGGFKGIDNKADFYIEPGNLIVYFQLYDYTPYVAGFPEFSFSLTKVISSDSKLFE
jgi:hypothetical protein